MKKLFYAVLATFLFASPAFAQQAEGAHGGPAVAIAAALAIGIAVLGGTFGQSRAAAAALEGIARNPGAASKVQTPMVLALALMESLVLFALVIAFMLVGKI